MIPIVSEQILQLFPLCAIPPRATDDTEDREEDTARLKEVQSSLVWRTPHTVGEDDESDSIRRPGELYKRYRTEEELPKEAKAFFGLAGESVLSQGAGQTLT